MTSDVTPEPSSDFLCNQAILTEIPKGKNKNRRKSAGKEIFSTHEKKTARIKRDKVGLPTPSGTSTPLADRKVTLAVIPELYNFTLGGEAQGYATEESDSISVLASSLATVIFAVSGGSEGKGKEKEDLGVGRYEGSPVWEDTMREE